MASFNKVIMAGNLTRDPELSYLPSQTPVVEFGLAVNRKWRDKQSGQQKESVCFVDCKCFGKSAETFKQYMSKGKPVLVEGRLDLDQWEGKDGTKRSKHSIFVENFTFLGGGDGQQAPQNQQAPPPPQQPAPAPEPEPPESGEDIPF